MINFSSGKKPESHLLMHRGNSQGCVPLCKHSHCTGLLLLVVNMCKLTNVIGLVPAVAPAIWCFLKDFAGEGVMVCIPRLGVQKWSFFQAAESSRPSISTCTACDCTLGAITDKAGKPCTECIAIFGIVHHCCHHCILGI